MAHAFPAFRTAMYITEEVFLSAGRFACKTRLGVAGAFFQTHYARSGSDYLFYYSGHSNASLL